MTPYELSLCIKDFNEKQKIEHEKRKIQFEEELTVAYFGAYWQRVEKLSIKNLKEVIDKINQPTNKKQMTNEEMLNKVKQLNAALGGEVR
ncbi:hypothetical protein [Neobacillus niacini]|uniref:hypothetical protein n=1 Tax=Neobacillus niacini TaxID=86668 RepID=UPI0021CB3B2A|nr:hypothetical protein [Neobacillus niacini]MCM3763443.1 hypothetical protein [Neobacillus niacini]